MLAGCGGGNGKDTAEKTGDSKGAASESQAAGESEGEVKIPIIITTGANDAMDIQMKEVVEDFNREYKGKYQMEVEYLAGASDDYRSKLKMLNASNSLPRQSRSVRNLPFMICLWKMTGWWMWHLIWKQTRNGRAS